MPIIFQQQMQQRMMDLMSMMPTNQAIQNRASLTLSSIFKDPRAKDPDTFDGVLPDRLNGFLMECELVFRLQASRFPTEDSKVLYLRVIYEE